jgi:hypothetical protein
MGIKNKHKTTRKKAQILKRKVVASAMCFTPLRFFIKNRRAVSAVMSNLILIGAVMAVGLVVLAYARSTSINYQTQYAQTMSSDIGKLKETLTFEYAYYKPSSHDVYIYFLNSGTVNIEIKSISINGSPKSFIMYTMHDVAIDNHVLASGQEGYLISNNPDLVSGTTYLVKLTSRSDSTFAYNFLV